MARIVNNSFRREYEAWLDGERIWIHQHVSKGALWHCSAVRDQEEFYLGVLASYLCGEWRFAQPGDDERAYVLTIEQVRSGEQSEQLLSPIKDLKDVTPIDHCDPLVFEDLLIAMEQVIRTDRDSHEITVEFLWEKVPQVEELVAGYIEEGELSFSDFERALDEYLTFGPLPELDEEGM